MQSHEQLITCYFEQVWNQGNLDILDQIIASNYINHSPGMPNPKPGPEGLKPIVSAMRQAFPDLHYTIEDLVLSDNKVAVYTTMRGTNDGDIFGLKPTNKTVEVKQMQIEYIRDGKITEHWRLTDDLSLMKQLGQL